MVVCIDFTNLNKAWLMDCFPLPKIEQLVDSTSGHALLSFMDAFSSYNQIRLDSANEVHTSFVTDFSTYNYKMMPSRLKNVRATYQQLVINVFKKQIGRNMEVYVNNINVKSC